MNQDKKKRRRAFDYVHLDHVRGDAYVQSLAQSVCRGHDQITELLLLQKKDVDIGSITIESGEPLLHVACRLKHYDIATMLCDHVDKEMKWEGKTALHVACEALDADCVRLLLGAGALTSTVTDDSKDTPLHCCFAKGHMDDTTLTALVEMLVQYGVDVNARNAQGLMPLHLLATTVPLKGEGFMYLIENTVLDPENTEILINRAMEGVGLSLLKFILKEEHVNSPLSDPKKMRLCKWILDASCTCPHEDRLPQQFMETILIPIVDHISLKTLWSCLKSKSIGEESEENILRAIITNIQEISAREITTFGKGEFECGICLCPLKLGHIMVTRCGHTCCSACWPKYAQKNRHNLKCFSCRNRIFESDTSKLYL